MGMQSAMAMLLSQVRAPTNRSVSRRLSEAWRPPAPGAAAPPAPEQPPQVDTFLAYSADELARARALVRRPGLHVRPLGTRRTRPAARGETDRARTPRAALPGCAARIALRHRARIERPAAI